MLHGFLRSKSISLGGKVYALNGVIEHVHTVVAIPPRIAVAKFIGRIKAVASKRINESEMIGFPFYWQEEYGVFSFDKKRLQNFVS